MKTKTYIFLTVLFLIIGDFTLNAQPCPNLEIQGDDNLIVCHGSDIVLVVDLFYGNTMCYDVEDLEFDWEGDGEGPQSDPFLEIDNITSDGTYSVTVTENNDIIDIDVIQIIVTGPISVEITLDDLSPPTCLGNDIVLMAEVSDQLGLVDYDWDGVNEMDEETATDFNVTGSNQDYAITVTDAEGCSAEDDINITINSAPSINISGELTYCEGSEIELTATGGNSCKWTLPDMTTTISGCTFSIPNANSMDTGNYEVEITDSNGCMNTESVTVSVQSEINVTLSPSPTIPNIGVCVNSPDIDLNPSLGEGDYTISGDTPNSDPISGDEFDPGDAGPGSYTISYMVDQGLCSASASVLIIVNPLPTANFGGLPELTENCGTINLSDFASPVGGNFYDQSGSTISNILNPSNIVSQMLEYRYIDPVTACENSDFTSLVIDPPMAITIDSDFDICVGSNNVELGVMATGGGGNYNYLWNNENFLTNNTIPNPVTINLPTGQHIFTVVVTDENNCEMIGSQTITVHPQPTVFLTVDPLGICIGDNVVLTADLTSNFGTPSYVFREVGGTGTASGSDQFSSPPIFSNISYEVQVTFEPSSAGCGPITSGLLNVLPQIRPEPMINTSATEGCSNQQMIFFSDNIKTGSTFAWNVFFPQPDIINMEQDGPVFIVQWGNNTSGSGIIEVIETLGNNCVGRDTMHINFSNGTAPDPAEIFLSPINNTLIYNDTSVSCYQWGYFDEVDGNVTLPGEEFQSYVAAGAYNPDLVYWCRVWGNDDCGECSTIAVYREGEGGGGIIEVEEPKFLLYPNPNEGNFQLAINQLFPNTEYDIQVINLLGQIVHEKAVLTNGDDDLSTTIQLGGVAAGVYYMALYLRGDLQKISSFVVQP